MREQERTFAKFLASRRARLTPERQAVLDGVLETGGHFTADDLYIRLKRRRPKVSRATVYRTLELLVASGLVDKVDLGAHQAFYENFYGRQHHDHLICLGCGEIIEFTEPGIEELQEKVCHETGFRMEYHSHKIFGRCARCQPAQSRGTRP